MPEPYWKTKHWWISGYRITNTEGAIRPTTDRYFNIPYGSEHERDLAYEQFAADPKVYDLSKHEG